jgi:hypothetical protein
MKKLLFWITLLCFTSGWSQDIVFKNPKDLADYAFSNTNFSNLPSQYLINRTVDLNEDAYNHYLHGNTDQVKGVHNLHLFGLLEWWDTRTKWNFKRDSVLFPVYDHFFTMDEEKPLHIPLFVVDINAAKVNNDIWDNFTSSTTSDPFPALTAADVSLQHIETASIYLDSFAYNNVYLDFNSLTFFSNRGREVSDIVLHRNGQIKHLVSGTPLDISDWLDGASLIRMEIIFNDGTSFAKEQLVEMNPILKEKGGSLFGNSYERIYGDATTATSIHNPEAHFSTYYACADKKMRKPFLMVAGWGPHTDKPLIINNQHWPASNAKLVAQFNQEGLIEDLHDKGFDVIIVSFSPPNASILKNCALLEKLIHKINDRKYANNSYEENIIMGFSAGALATRLTLQQMEKKHLEQGALHPHTKLFISNDGENGGANVPLGMQHAVKYLMNYEFNNFPTDYDIYALHYILNAALSRELLHYFHSATGSGDTPGQGPDVMRTAYLQYHTWNNHALNIHNPGYPSFQRNISISNGSSVPLYNFSDYTSNHEPYPNEAGAIFFKQSGSMMGWVNRRFEATFLKHGVHRVFYYEFKPLFKAWRSGYEAKTSNPLVLDNAPGGVIFIEQNPIKNINDELQSELTGSPDISKDLLFSFTPTILTHDVKNLASSLVNGYPNYNFKNAELMYDNETAANIGNPTNASNFYGYPHLGYPGSHYDIVPFDAVFSWDQNTEHLIGNRKSNDFYTGVWSAMKPVLKNFIVEEAEPWNIFLQNKSIGHYARDEYTYRVDYEAQYGIYLGEHVTQKTDFVEMTSESNAVVEAQAGAEIVFKAGVHLKAGTTFHAFIGDISCEKSITSFDSPADEQNRNNGLNALHIETSVIEPTIYPNPNNGSFSIIWDGVSSGTELLLSVYDLTGKHLISANSTVKSEVKHELQNGLYILKIQKGELWYSKRIVVE